MTGISRRRALAVTAAGAVGGAFGAAACAGGPGQPGAPARTLGGSVQFWTNPQYPFNEDVGGEIARDFTARTSGVTVEGVPTPGSMVEKVTAAAAGGTPPDLATVDIYTPQSLAASGATRAVEDYLKGSRAVKKTDLWPTHVTDLTYKGSMVAMPMGPDLRILYISSDRYRATGLDPDKPPGRGPTSSRRWPGSSGPAATRSSTSASTRCSAAGGCTAGWCPTGNWGARRSAPTAKR